MYHRIHTSGMVETVMLHCCVTYGLFQTYIRTRLSHGAELADRNNRHHSQVADLCITLGVLAATKRSSRKMHRQI